MAGVRPAARLRKGGRPGFAARGARGGAAAGGRRQVAGAKAFACPGRYRTKLTFDGTDPARVGAARDAFLVELPAETLVKTE